MSSGIGFVEPRPDIVVPNPGGAADPLGESVLDPAQPWLRVYEPADLRVVIGRGQDPARELRLDTITVDGVPVHRRATGGGAVVLAPGMVVVAMRLRPGMLAPDAWFGRINAVLGPAITAAAGVPAATRGHGDLAVELPGGEPRKILGASLRQTARMVAYLGVLLVEDAVPAMERYLAPPSRMPSYRAGRGHAAFCTHLARFGVAAAGLVRTVERACAADLADLAGT